MINEEQSKTYKAIAYAWSVMRKRPLYLLFIFLAFLIDSICDAFTPKLTANFLSSFENGLDLDNAYKSGLLLVGVCWLGCYLFQYIGHTLNALYQTAGMSDIYNALYDRVQYAPHSWHSSTHMGSTVVKISRAVRGFEVFSDRIYLDGGFFMSLLAIIVTVSILTWHYLYLGLIIALCITISSIFIIVASLLYVSPANRNANTEESNLGAIIADRIIGNYSVKSFTKERIEKEILEKRIKKWRVIEYKSWMRAHFISLAYKCLTILCVGISIYFCIHYIEEGTMPLSDVAMVILTIITINGYAKRLGHIMLEIQKSLNDIEDALFLSKLTPEKNGIQSLTKFNKAITCKNIELIYPNTSSTVLNIKELSIPKGQKIGLIGPSGAGKSSLIALLTRFYDATHGSILIDDMNIKDITLETLRSHIAVIPQDTTLFHESILENIRYGRINASDEDVIQAAKKAFAHDFISQLKDGYQTTVGERGVKLSGGQRQRIAIARAILKDAPILILDEATSALDSESEHAIQNSLKDLIKDKTVIAIAHRLSTISHLDRLIVMENGEIKEDGSHAELLHRNQLYAKLWKMQVDGFLK